MESYSLKEFETQSIEKYFCKNKIEIRQLVVEKKIFKDFVPGCHGNKGNISSQ